MAMKTLKMGVENWVFACTEKTKEKIQAKCQQPKSKSDVVVFLALLFAVWNVCVHA